MNFFISIFMRKQCFKKSVEQSYIHVTADNQIVHEQLNCTVFRLDSSVRMTQVCISSLTQPRAFPAATLPAASLTCTIIRGTVGSNS